jgi:hypothetical protein
MMHDGHEVRIVPHDTCHGEDPNDVIRLGDDEVANFQCSFIKSMAADMPSV